MPIGIMRFLVCSTTSGSCSEAEFGENIFAINSMKKVNTTRDPSTQTNTFRKSLSFSTLTILSWLQSPIYSFFDITVAWVFRDCGPHSRYHDSRAV
jgi:hypothetical protein